MTNDTRSMIPALLLALFAMSAFGAGPLPYPIVDTGQVKYYDNSSEIASPARGEPFFGQDAHYRGNVPSYRDNGDGTVSDLVTGLMWQKSPGEKMNLEEALSDAASRKLAGHTDWRVPTVKELYSLILFTGTDPDPRGTDTTNLKPFIDTDHFDFQYGDPAKGERVIDSQYGSRTEYTDTTMRGNRTMFGVNFADGRIKGYPLNSPRTRGESTYYFIYVRGSPDYGKNDYIDNGDGTVTDRATGLMWTQVDSGFFKAGERQDGSLNWEEALKWAESLKYAGHSDWRLPNVKELQSIVDYTRSPGATNSPAINPVFKLTEIIDEAGNENYPFYWTGSTHLGMSRAATADYIAFGEALGWMPNRRTGKHTLLDVHGAGSQRSDPKSGDPSRFPRGRGPQGDVIRIYNHVLCVREGKADAVKADSRTEKRTGLPRQRSVPLGDGHDPLDNRPEKSSTFMNRADRNNDGRVSRDEFRGRNFERWDENRDGFITDVEAPEGGRRMRASQRAGTTQEGSSLPRFKNPFRSPHPPSKSSPNFVLILVDDMGWTGLSAPMDEKIPDSKSDFYRTPRIDELAKHGMRFSKAYAPAPMCTPSRAGILTGKSPAQLQMTTPGPVPRPPFTKKMIPPSHVRNLPLREKTLPEVLRQKDYATAHFGKWHLGGRGPHRHGFDEHDGDTGNGGAGLYKDPNPKDIFGITSRAIVFMDRHAHAGRPFYLQLSHYALHSPCESLKKTKAEFEDLPAGKRHSSTDYAAMTKDLDHAVGMLLDEIDRLDITDNTYLIFTSDNGGGGGLSRNENLPLRGVKAMLLEGGIRVPLIVKGPGIEPGNFNTTTVTGLDLFPTVCELAGIGSLPSGMEGTSLVPLLTGKPNRFKRAPNSLFFHFPHYGKGPEQIPQSAVISGNFKLIKFYETGKTNVYDLSEDIGEQRDISEENPSRTESMSTALEDYLRKINAQLPTVNPDYRPEKGFESRRKRP